MKTQDEIKKLLSTLSPDQQAFAKAVTLMRIEHATMTQQLADIKPFYDDLYKIMLVILHAQPSRELRIHDSQFLRFKEEYRIDRMYDKEKSEVVIRLLTVHDDVAE